MPTPLTSATVQSPGLKGLLTQEQSITIEPDCALVANNCVFDNNGRLAARKGYNKLTSSALSGNPDIEQIFEFEKDKDTSFIISTATVSSSKKIHHGTSSLTDITGSLSPSANNWQFVNFNNKVVGVQQSESPIVWTGTGNFAAISAASGSVPQGNCVASVYGRLFVADTNKTDIKYCAQLDETHWSTGGGTIDTAIYWPNGMDFIVAIAEFNNQLVVFGRHSILIWSGMHSPTTTPTLSDMIEGVGCIARDSVQNVGDDLIFLDDSGVRSLVRSIELKSQPLTELSKNIRLDLRTSVNLVSDKGKIKSAHDPVDGFYLLVTPGAVDETWVFDTKQPLEDLSLRVTRWDSVAINSLYYSPVDELLYLGGEGTIGKYDGYQDNGTSYTFDFESCWTDFGTTNLKVFKTIKTTTVGGANTTVSVKWKVDFEDSSESASYVIADFDASEWGTAQYGIDEYGVSDFAVRMNNVSASRTGQHVSFGLSVDIDGNAFAIQKMDILAKAGRVNR